jgi:Ca2+-binding RTX toxin-like protein
MAAFTFQTISGAQAAAYTAADSLSLGGSVASQVSVAYLPDGAAITLDGATINFGLGIINDDDLTFTNGGRLFIAGTGNDVLSGGAVSDALFAGAGNDTLNGGDGGDLLQGNQGADSLVGGAGNDSIYGGQDNDTIVLGPVAGEANWTNGNKGADTINAAGADTVLGGQDNDLITGGAGACFLNGNLGDDTIIAGASADTILGEGGRDVLSGGGGGNTFVFGAGSSAMTAAGSDVITDWQAGDRIDLPFAGGYTEIAPQGGGGDPYYGGGGNPTPYTFDSGLAAANNAVAMDGSLRVVAVQVGGDVVVFADTDGQGGLDLAVTLTGAILGAVDASSFI